MGQRTTTIGRKQETTDNRIWATMAWQQLARNRQLTTLEQSLPKASSRPETTSNGQRTTGN